MIAATSRLCVRSTRCPTTAAPSKASASKIGVAPPVCGRPPTCWLHGFRPQLSCCTEYTPLANLLKRKIKASVTRLDELGISFDYDGSVSGEDARVILDKITSLHDRALAAGRATKNPDRAQSLRQFADSLNKAFYGFEPDFFHQNLLRIVGDVVDVIRSSIQLWPTLVEICYFQKSRRGLPSVRVRNHSRQVQRAG